MLYLLVIKEMLNETTHQIAKILKSGSTNYWWTPGEKGNLYIPIGSVNIYNYLETSLA